MRLLLDTHIFVWGLLAPERIAAAVAVELERADNELWLSSVSVWEAHLLAEKGRIRVRPDAATWVRQALSRVPAKPVPVSHEVALQSRQVRLGHEDPADRFIAATAMVHDLTLVTSDQRLLDCPDIATLPNA